MRGFFCPLLDCRLKKCYYDYNMRETPYRETAPEEEAELEDGRHDADLEELWNRPLDEPTKDDDRRRFAAIPRGVRERFREKKMAERERKRGEFEMTMREIDNKIEAMHALGRLGRTRSEDEPPASDDRADREVRQKEEDRRAIKETEGLIARLKTEEERTAEERWFAGGEAASRREGLRDAWETLQTLDVEGVPASEKVAFAEERLKHLRELAKTDKYRHSEVLQERIKRLELLWEQYVLEAAEEAEVKKDGEGKAA